VVFEVDEHSQLFEWRSVVVRGPLYLIEPGTTAAKASVHAKAVGLIRRLVTSALSGSDPVPFRDQLFRIRVVEISGRASEPTGGKRVCPLSQQPTVRNGEPESDAVVRQQVETALETLSLAPTSRIQLDVFDGVVVLTGSTQDSAERSEIEAAVLEVPEVEAVVQQLETAFPPQPQPAPAEIARDALTLLRQSPAVSDPGIKIIAEHGWLRLEGVANSRRSRDEVVRRLRGVKGSRGVIDKLRVMGPAAARVVAE
jgi:osmotically-inducible protein OsmY